MGSVQLTQRLGAIVPLVLTVLGLGVLNAEW